MAAAFGGPSTLKRNESEMRQPQAASFAFPKHLTLNSQYAGLPSLKETLLIMSGII